MSRQSPDCALTSTNVIWQPGALTREQRWEALGHRGATIWFTGLPAAGKSTLAAAVEQRLIAAGRSAFVLDGDNLRHGLCGDLGFGRMDRDENVRRTGQVARLFAEAGTVALVALVSPFARERARVRELHRASALPFIEVFVNTPLELCEARDPKGLYRRARAGVVSVVTGIDDPYEPPSAAELEISPELPVADAAAAVVAVLDPLG